MAVHYLLSAAEKAKAQYAYPQAVHFCARALEAAAHAQALHEDRVRGLALMGDRWSLMGDLEQANRSYAQALETTADPTVQRWMVNKRHRSHLVVRNGVRIAFYEHGSGEPTLVFTNPILYGLATFQPVLERLCQEFRILTIDPRGGGASDPLQRPYTITDHMEDVRAVDRSLLERAGGWDRNFSGREPAGPACRGLPGTGARARYGRDATRPAGPTPD